MNPTAPLKSLPRSSLTCSTAASTASLWVMKSSQASLGSDTLKLALEKDTHAITAYLAYAFESSGVTANAVLPFNVEVYVTE